MKKKIAILGSTGSIGVNALNVIDNLADKFNVKARKNDQLASLDQMIKKLGDSSSAEND